MLHFTTFPSAQLLLCHSTMIVGKIKCVNQWGINVYDAISIHQKTSITGSAFVITVKSKRNCGKKFLQWRSVFWCTWHPSDSWYDMALESHWLQALKSHWTSHDPVRVCISYSMFLKIKQNKFKNKQTNKKTTDVVHQGWTHPGNRWSHISVFLLNIFKNLFTVYLSNKCLNFKATTKFYSACPDVSSASTTAAFTTFGHCEKKKKSWALSSWKYLNSHRASI